MKVAILTHPLGRNYGGIMQAWAFQKVLRRMGVEPVTIDRRSDSPNIIQRSQQICSRVLKKVTGKRMAPINFESHLPTILHNNHLFVSKSMNLSESINSSDDLRVHFARHDYDAVIVGSDQIWRPKFTPNMGEYYLDFLKQKDMKRVAYAASFGVDSWEYNKRQTVIYSDLVKKFNSISVREDSAVDMCSRFLGVNATHVLDPTLLLSKADYCDLIGDERLEKESKGVYTYFLDKSVLKDEMSNQIANRISQPVYSCQPKYNLNEDYSDISGYVFPDIRDWLSGFANSKFVLTDSFHGMVFSILFEKPFLVVTNSGRGAARFKSLAKISQTESKLIDIGVKIPGNIYSNLMLEKTINIINVNNSLEWLKKALF